MDYMIIQENINNYLYYFRLLIINLGAYCIFLKTVKNQSTKFTKTIILILILGVTAIELYETVNGNELNGIIITMLLLILLFDWLSTDTMSFTIVALGMSYIIFFVAVVISGIVNILFNIKNDIIAFLCISLVYFILLFRVMSLNKIKNGFSFLNKRNKNNFFDLLMINLSVIVLFCIVMLKNCDILLINQMAIFVVILSIIMLITIKKSFQVYYKQKLLMKQLEEADNEIINQQKEIEKLEQENLNFSKKSHSLAHKQKSLEYKLNQLLMNEEIAKELDIKDRIEEISAELYKNPVEDLTKTGITKIDDMLKFMQSECVKNNIDFSLQISGNVYHIINNIINVEQLEILLADHIKDAIIAIKHSDNINKSILVRLGKIEDTYGLYIYDSGIEFEKETLKNLGKKPSTTHKDEGGTGMGFMNTFDTLRKCNGSLIINEIGKPTKENYTKIVMIKFDNKNEFKIISYRE